MIPVEISLEAYLDALDAQLNDLPPARRIEIVGETREHLEAMTAARRADGLDENAAWQSARQAFGEAETIGRELAREWKRDPRVETVGSPLSKREKAILFVRPVAFLLALFGIYTAIIIGCRLESHWQNGFLALVFSSCGFLGISRWLGNGGKWTLLTLISAAFFFSALMWFVLDLLFASQLRGTGWGVVLSSPWSIAILFACAMILRRRQAKSATPWRNSPQYAQNPIAAEEIYRLNPKLALVIGSTVGCVGYMWIGWKLIDLRFAAMMCSMEIVVTYLFLRRPRP